ncbi:hypothetical protein LAZ67_10001723 [Cordylochernes scorpioides]|uniref:Uncharacterized protein n=1 Tax=Cordylochernes scorpioides TaxID=51811 RepID=A0ABY6KW14_9ARAC|nr:hypothetical protein LAZ67_10001723 [Cordylochernes scorpioides]
MPRHSRRLLGRNTAASRRYRNARAIETPLQSETRRALRRLRYSEARVAATQTMQVPVQRIQLWTHKPFSGLQYNAHIDYKADSSVDIGQMSRVSQNWQMPPKPTKEKAMSVRPCQQKWQRLKPSQPDHLYNRGGGKKRYCRANKRQQAATRTSQSEVGSGNI